MAIIDKAVLSGTIEGKVEDVSDLITSLDPDETYLTNQFGRTTVTNTKHEWLVDSLRPARDNATMEAHDFDVQEARTRGRDYNYCQQFENGYSVTDTTQAVKKYGVRDELAYQFVKCGKETARDLEYAIVNSATLKDEDTDPARMGGVSHFLGATKTVESGTTAGVFTITGHKLFTGDPLIMEGTLDANFKANTPYYVKVLTANTFKLYATPQGTMDDDATALVPALAITSGVLNVTNQNVIDAAKTTSAGVLTFDVVNDAMQLAYNRGAQLEEIVCSSKNKRVISGFTAGVQKTADMSRKDLVQAVDIIDTDFGRIAVKAHRQYPSNVVDIFEYQYWKLGYLIPFHTEMPPRTGTYQQKVITGSCTLECTAPISSARIKGITTA